MVQETSPIHITTAIGTQMYSTIIARRPNAKNAITNAIIKTTPSAMPTASNNIFVIFMVNIFFIAYANIENFLAFANFME